jgi:hypothetical protein
MPSIVESVQYTVRSAQVSPAATMIKSVATQRNPKLFTFRFSLFTFRHQSKPLFTLHSSLFTSEENR